MTPSSLLVMTTPNPFDFSQMMQVLLRGRVVLNAQHTVWIDPHVMCELLDREGFEPVCMEWVDSDPGARPEGWPSRALARTASVVSRFRPVTRPNYGVVARLAS
jgi:hypothetical protein